MRGHGGDCRASATGGIEPADVSVAIDYARASANDDDEYGQRNSIDREGPVAVGSHIVQQPDDCDQAEYGGGRKPPSKLWREARMEKFMRFDAARRPR